MWLFGCEGPSVTFSACFLALEETRSSRECKILSMSFTGDVATCYILFRLQSQIGSILRWWRQTHWWLCRTWLTAHIIKADRPFLAMLASLYLSWDTVVPRKQKVSLDTVQYGKGRHCGDLNSGPAVQLPIYRETCHRIGWDQWLVLPASFKKWTEGP